MQGLNSFSEKIIRDFDTRPIKTTVSDCVVIDGVFMFTTKEIALRHLFDESRFNGFHGYDLDFSTRVFFEREKSCCQ